MATNGYYKAKRVLGIHAAAKSPDRIVPYQLSAVDTFAESANTSEIGTKKAESKLRLLHQRNEFWNVSAANVFFVERFDFFVNTSYLSHCQQRRKTQPGCEADAPGFKFGISYSTATRPSAAPLSRSVCQVSSVHYRVGVASDDVTDAVTSSATDGFTCPLGGP
ncbi:hypothetical protein EVAR_55444_1 [Eumeta japonica]|uniref:Uncharacterized protein n=1 Tax=Eumeta variegata TaxID=151549 RepID=A0A4C1Y6R4_EUMVA|nr:hypothetical protein EVAR_55444_1 [Eumeta japonica]